MIVRTAGIIGGTGGGHNSNGQPLTIRGCKTESGALITGTLNNERIAGIAGMPNDASVVIENCVNNADVVAVTGWAAGIAANSRCVNMVNCANTGTIQGSKAAAGIAFGYSSSYNAGTLTNCYNVGDVISESGPASGLVGSTGTSGTAPGKITNCYFYGTLKGATQNAVVLSTHAANMTITNTYYNLKDTEGEVFAPDGAVEAGAERFASGEIAYLLDGGAGARRNVWTQGKDYPVIGQPGVYKVTTEVVGRGEAATLTVTPDSTYVVGNTEIRVNVTLDNSNADKTYVYTLVATDDAGSHNITEIGSLVLSSDTHVVARVQLTDEVYEEEPEPTHGGGSGSDENPGDGDGENTGDGSGTGEDIGSGEGDGVTENTGTGTTGSPSGQPAQNEAVQAVTNTGMTEQSEQTEPIITEPLETEPEQPEENEQPEAPETPETPEEDDNLLEEESEISETAKRNIWPVVLLIVAVVAAALFFLLFLLKKKGDKTTVGR